MYKVGVVKRVAKETRLTQKIVADVLTAEHRLIEQRLRDGKTVTFPGFGTFYTSQLHGGTVRSIRTGQPVQYAARPVARFRAGELLKRAVRGENRLGRSRQQKAKAKQ